MSLIVTDGSGAQFGFDGQLEGRDLLVRVNGSTLSFRRQVLHDTMSELSGRPLGDAEAFELWRTRQLEEAERTIAKVNRITAFDPKEIVETLALWNLCAHPELLEDTILLNLSSSDTGLFDDTFEPIDATRSDSDEMFAARVVEMDEMDEVDEIDSEWDPLKGYDAFRRRALDRLVSAGLAGVAERVPRERGEQPRRPTDPAEPTSDTD